MIDTRPYRIAPGKRVDLCDFATHEDGGLSKKTGKEMVHELTKRLAVLQELLYAQRSKGLLVVFQAMDAGGKDSTIRRVFRLLDPSSMRVKSFKQPSQREQLHDFLWRIHQHAPRRGHISVFNRSHYEDVVAVRVRERQPQEVWQKRFEHINAFERLLSTEGTLILKFFLHISKDYQKQRLQRRLERPDKVWKFDPADINDRKYWDEYMHAYSEAIESCSTDNAPFYVVPAERRWYRDLIVLQTVVDALDSLQMTYPEPKFDPADIELI